jgi:hypothetical protein
VNLLEIKTQVANYFGAALADLTVLSQDMFLVEANQTRLEAEMNNDFEFSRKLLSLSVNGVTGGSLDLAVEYGTASPVIKVNSIVEVGLFDTNGNLRTVEYTTVAEGLERQRSDNAFQAPRYPTDGWFQSDPAGQGRFQFSGTKVYRFPLDSGNNFTLGLEAYTFHNDWVTGDLAGTPVTDVWTTRGAQYIMWGTIVRLNHLFKEFVPRTEGNLITHRDMAAQGLASLVQWDASMYERNRRHGR